MPSQIENKLLEFMKKHDFRCYCLSDGELTFRDKNDLVFCKREFAPGSEIKKAWIVLEEEALKAIPEADNRKNPIIEVLHDKLQRSSEHSDLKSECIKCNSGNMVMRRNEKTLRLEEHDVCLNCGQRYKYLDILQVRLKVGPL
jgi:Zn finger protein HypA/HybF involved in hydrogenase expression